MSVFSSELSKKIDSTLLKTSSSESEGPDGSFRKLLEISEVNEYPSRSLFSLIEEEEETEEEPVIITLCPPICNTPIISAESPLSTSSSSSIHLSTDVEALFEKMTSQMMVMELSSETHTTLFLDQPQFEGSSFFGTKIIIKEFSTAPKAFNVEILSNPQAIRLIQNQQHNLLTVFTQGNFPFTIHRFDTQIDQDSTQSLLYRIEGEEEGDSENQEQHKDRQS